MGPNRLREIIPIFVLATVAVSGLGLLFEIVGASARGIAADPVATPVLGTIFGTSFSGLLALWFKSSEPQPPEPPSPPPAPAETVKAAPSRPPDIDPEEWNDEGGYRYLLRRGEGDRWKLC